MELVGRTVVSIAVMLVLAPLNALVQTFALHKAWDWFLSEQYGPGPTRASWYGVILIAGFMLTIATMSLARTENKNSFATKLFISSIVSWIVVLVMLAGGYVVGSMFSWM